jgi:hypothetical protein
MYIWKKQLRSCSDMPYTICIYKNPKREVILRNDIRRVMVFVHCISFPPFNIVTNFMKFSPLNAPEKLFI